MSWSKRLLVAAGALALLSGCGGGGGGGGAPPTGGGPAPSPTPSPAPTPTPTPTVRAYTVSAVTGRLDFFTGNASALDDTLAQGFLSRDGFYTPGYRNALSPYVGLGPGGSLTADYADRYKRAAVFEHETSLYLFMDAPREARVVTPVTALMTSPGLDQAKLKRQLGLVGGGFGLSSDPDLLTYDAVAELASTDPARSRDGSRMLAANLRVLAIVRGLAAMGRPMAGVVNDLNIAQPQDFTRVGDCLAAAGDLFVFTNERMTALAACVQQRTQPFVIVRPQTLSAIAHLIDAYAAAIPVNLDSPEGQARWRLGVEGWLVPEIVRLANAQSDSADAAASAILTPTIIAETQIYTERFRYNATGLFFAGPDFYALPAGGTLTLSAGDGASPPSNDFLITGTDGGFSRGAIQSVTVPSAFAARITAVLQAGTITVAATPGAPLAAYFDYVAQHPTGGAQTARVYLRVY